MRAKQVIVLAALFAAMVMRGAPAIAQGEPKEVYPGPIDVNKMDAARRAVDPYSFYVPPYNLYYFHHIDKLNIRAGPVFVPVAP